MKTFSFYLDNKQIEEPQGVIRKNHPDNHVIFEKGTELFAFFDEKIKDRAFLHKRIPFRVHETTNGVHRLYFYGEIKVMEYSRVSRGISDGYKVTIRFPLHPLENKYTYSDGTTVDTCLPENYDDPAAWVN